MITFRELADYTAAETNRWRDWFAQQPPAVLEISAGTGRTATIRGLIHHVVVVEQRYIARLRDEPVPAYAEIPADPIAETFRVFNAGRDRLDLWLASATDADLAKRLEFQTLTAGTQSASARKIVAHLLLHGVRHWAQIATILRQNGHSIDGWFHDILMSDALS